MRIREVSPEELDFVSAVCLDPSREVARALLERCIEKARAHGGVSVLAYDGDKWFWVLEVKFYPTNQPTNHFITHKNSLTQLHSSYSTYTYTYPYTTRTHTECVNEGRLKRALMFCPHFR